MNLIKSEGNPRNHASGREQRESMRQGARVVKDYCSLLLSSSLWRRAGFWANTVSTLSTLSRASKKGRRSLSSVSFGSSNQDVTGTCTGGVDTSAMIHQKGSSPEWRDGAATAHGTVRAATTVSA